MQLKTIFTMTAVVSLSAATQVSGNIVYSNAVTYSGFYLNPGLSEVGDEIILGPGPRLASTFRFEYFANNLQSGGLANEQFRIRFYNNTTGFPNDVGVFYDSGLVALPVPTDVSGRNTLQFDLSFETIILPNDFTWSIQFSGIDAGAGEVAGLSIYDPPNVGNGFDDYWLRNGLGNWELRGSNGVPISFGAAITAVPEPSTYVLAILGGLCGLALFTRRGARKH